MRVVCLVMDGVLSTAFDSQVLGEVVPLREAGVDARLVVWTRTGAANAYRRRAEGIRRALGDAVRLLERGRNFIRFSRPRLLRDLHAALADWGIGPEQRFICCARSPFAGYLGLALKQRMPGCTLVTDFRGAASVEYRRAYRTLPLPARLLGPLHVRWIRRIEALTARRSDHLRCVSQAGRELLARRYGLDPAGISVVPCFVDTRRFGFDPQVRAESRRRLEIGPDRFAVLYCGSLGPTSPSDLGLIARTYKRLSRLGRPACLLVVTRDRELAQRDLAAHSIPPDQLRVMSAEHHQVPRWLQAGDLGLMVRRPTEVDHVACPIKFGEYLRSGVRTLISPCIGDLAALTARHRLGWFAQPDQPLPEGITRPYGDDERARISAAAAELLGHERHVPRIIRLYDRLLAAGAEPEPAAGREELPVTEAG